MWNLFSVNTRRINLVIVWSNKNQKLLPEKYIQMQKCIPSTYWNALERNSFDTVLEAFAEAISDSSKIRT